MNYMKLSENLAKQTPFTEESLNKTIATSHGLKLVLHGATDRATKKYRLHLEVDGLKLGSFIEPDSLQYKREIFGGKRKMAMMAAEVDCLDLWRIINSVLESQLNLLKHCVRHYKDKSAFNRMAPVLREICVEMQKANLELFKKGEPYMTNEQIMFVLRMGAGNGV